VYGGVRQGVMDDKVLLAISTSPDAKVYQRNASTLNPTPVAGPSNWNSCQGLSVNPMNYFEALVACTQGGGQFGSDIWMSHDFGTTWTAISGNLLAQSGAPFSARPQSTLIVPLPDGERAYLVSLFAYRSFLFLFQCAYPIVSPRAWFLAFACMIRLVLSTACTTPLLVIRPTGLAWVPRLSFRFHMLCR
jgi:hypothetical protein